MTPEEEIKKLKEDNEKLLKENGEFKTSNTKLGEDLKVRDESITQLKKNAQERGEQFKKLKDMSEAERELLSEKEKELLLRQEKLEEERAQDLKTQKDRDEKQKNYVIDNLANKMAKGNKDLAEQIKINLGKLNPELLKDAMTEQDLAPHIDTAFKMTGVSSQPDPLRTAHNTDGSGAPIKSENDFSETKEGKDLAGALGLSQATPPVTPPAEEKK